MSGDTVAHSDIDLAADQFPLVHLLLAVSRVAQMNAMNPCDIRGDFEVFQIACVIAASAQSIAV